MASILDLNDTSDSENDADFVPSGAAEESNDSSVSEISDNDLKSGKTVSGKVKRKRRSVKKNQETIPAPEVVSKLAPVDEKKRANDLWQSFLEDVKVDYSLPPKKTDNLNVSKVADEKRIPECATVTPSDNFLPKKDKEPVVRKVFEFAGETFISDATPSSSISSKFSPLSEKGKISPIGKRGGLDSVLGAISNKKQKLNTLDKTALDWKTFKCEEGLDNDLERFNKGRAGYLERQKFLQRADLRSFEFEKTMRQANRKK